MVSRWRHTDAAHLQASQPPALPAYCYKHVLQACSTFWVPQPLSGQLKQAGVQRQQQPTRTRMLPLPRVLRKLLGSVPPMEEMMTTCLTPAESRVLGWVGGWVGIRLVSPLVLCVYNRPEERQKRE